MEKIKTLTNIQINDYIKECLKESDSQSDDVYVLFDTLFSEMLFNYIKYSLQSENILSELKAMRTLNKKIDYIINSVEKESNSTANELFSKVIQLAKSINDKVKLSKQEVKEKLKEREYRNVKDPSVYFVMPVLINLIDSKKLVESICKSTNIPVDKSVSDFDEKAKYEDHFILIIINITYKQVLIFDSLNIGFIDQLWKYIIGNWINSKAINSNFEKMLNSDLKWVSSRFANKIVHQKLSLCSYYVLLYFKLFFFEGLEQNEISTLNQCSDKYLIETFIPSLEMESNKK